MIKKEPEKKSVTVSDIVDEASREPKSGFRSPHIIDLRSVPEPAPAAFPHIRKIVFTLAFGTIFLVTVVSLAGFSYFRSAKAFADGDREKIIDNFVAALQDIRSFRPRDAEKKLLSNESAIESLSESAPKNIFFRFASVLIPIFDSTDIIRNAVSFNSDLLELSRVLSDVKENGLQYLQTDGERLLTQLRTVSRLLKSTERYSTFFRNTIVFLERFFPSALGDTGNVLAEYYLKSNLQLYELGDFVDGLIALLEGDKPKHILVFFQNNSEIRPAGGFLGSYADVSIADGKVTSVQVSDILVPDSESSFNEKIIPPLPFQFTSRNRKWQIRDANWFFDFPLSAEKVMQLLESSDVYRTQSVKFEGVISINLTVLEDILTLLKEIRIDDTLVITKENVNDVLRNEIESKRKKKDENPKYILQTLTSLLLDAVRTLESESQRALLQNLVYHVNQKNIIFSFRSRSIEHFLSSSGINGEVYRMPSTFWGTYLAVVNANINGEKSDAYVREQISLDVDLDTLGNALTALTIERAHTGNTRKELWWRAKNQNFIQIFTPLGSNLISVRGNSIKKTPVAVDYKAEGYREDPDIANIENTKTFLPILNTWRMEAFEKTVFGTWFDISAGETRKLILRYESHPAKNFKLAAENTYTFIFEKQSGVVSPLTLRIRAPIGYVWEENGEVAYTYTYDNPPARIILPLTFHKQ